MEKNIWKNTYEAPSIEWIDVAVEAGFAVSYETETSTTPFDPDGGEDNEEWN